MEKDSSLVEVFERLKSCASDFLEETSTKKSSLDRVLPSELKSQEGLGIYTDGACRGNPGPGGWGTVAQDIKGKILFELSGYSSETTNNRMELTAAIEGLSEAKGFYQGQEVILVTDSKYLKDGLEKWVQGWKERGWKKADGKSPENIDLWQQLDSLKDDFPNLKIMWVKGHSGHPQNEYCDFLSNKAIDEA